VLPLLNFFLSFGHLDERIIKVRRGVFLLAHPLITTAFGNPMQKVTPMWTVDRDIQQIRMMMKQGVQALSDSIVLGVYLQLPKSRRAWIKSSETNKKSRAEPGATPRAMLL
jgi:hypothetical protein